MTSAISRLAMRHRSLDRVLLDQAMVSGIGFLTTIVLARLLGIEESGVFALAWIVVLFVLGVQFALLVSPMNSIGPKRPTDHNRRDFAAHYGQQIRFSSLAITGRDGNRRHHNGEAPIQRPECLRKADSLYRSHDKDASRGPYWFSPQVTVR